MSSVAYPANPYAPSYFQGVNTPPPDLTGYDPRPFTYIYNPPNNQLTANQNILGDSVTIDVDADFLAYGWYCSLFTGEFQVQLIDSTGYNLISGYLNSGALSQSSANPTIFTPSHPFPAGGRIQLNIQDLSAATNPLQLAFVGVKLFRTKRAA